MASDGYEAQRLEIIARNRARLQQLGLADAAEKFVATTAKPKKPAAPQKPKPQPGPPTRHSRRQGGQAPAELNEEERQLAAMYVDGVCPKCGQAVSKGMKQHFSRCSGKPKRHRRSPDADIGGKVIGGPGYVEEDEDNGDEDEGGVDGRSVRKLPPVDHKKLARKLKELEMSGLIDFSPDKAQFAVLGSTGSKYVVTLAAARHSCQCMDFRIRRRECKHIRLVLQQLGVAKHPQDWHQAVDRQLDAAAKSEAAGGGAGGGDSCAAVDTDTPETDAAETEDADGDGHAAGKASKRKGPRGSRASGKRQKAAAQASPKGETKGGGRKGGRKVGAGGTEGTSPAIKPGTRRMPRSLR